MSAEHLPTGSEELRVHLKPETIFKQHAYKALECYAQENKALGYAKWTYKNANLLVLDGYPEYDEEVTKLRNRSSAAELKARECRLRAVSLFAAAIGIPAKREVIKDKKDRYHEVVVAQDPVQQRELQSRYRSFRQLYGEPVNAKRRDKVRKGKADIIIPSYSSADRHFDRVLDRYKAAKAAGKYFVDPKAAGFPETTLNEPGEPVLAVYLVDAYSLMLESLAARGIRVSRYFYNGDFKERLFAAVEPDTSQLSLPSRYEHESVKAYAERTKLSKDQLVRLAKMLHRRALGYTAMWEAAEAGQEGIPDKETLQTWMQTAWREEWLLRNGWEDDSRVAIDDQRLWLKESIKLFRAVQRARNRAIKAAEPPKRRGKKPRTGQISLLDNA